MKNLLFLSLICYVFTTVLSIAERDFIVNLSFLVNIILCVFAIFYLFPNRFSLFKVFFTFQFLFMSYIPFVEFNTRTYYWGGASFSNSDYLYFNILLFLVNVLYIFFYALPYFKRRALEGEVEQVLSDKSYNPYQRFYIVFLIVLSIYGLLFLNNFSILSVLIRSGELKDSAEVTSSLATTIRYVSKFVPLFCCLFIFSMKNEPLWLKFICFFGVFIVAFPIGNARFLVAAVYIPLVCVVFPTILNSMKGVYAILLSIVFVFPFLNQFRILKDNIDVKFFPELEFFLGGHFDSYQNFLRVFTEDFVTNGQQLLGSIFFFIPRAFWESKPYGSGYLIASEFGYFFDNISMNFIGEGFINFGLIGVFVFVFVLSTISSYFDFKYMALLKSGNFNPSSLFYLFGLGFLTFILRGDLLSASAFLFSGYFSFLVVKLSSVKLNYR